MATLYRLLQTLVMGCLIAVGLLWWFLTGPGSGIEFYTVEEQALYETLTDDIIKGAPRISTNYRFVYYPPQGSASEVSAVYFEDTTDIVSLRDYLISIGCTLDRTEVHVENWLSKDKTKAITIFVDPKGKTVDLEIRLPPPWWW
ncbi:hypothetical protein ACIPSR_19885 [Pectobacterium sp. CHL-2024]|uniref:Uncharacterized protein n=2 Tax=Pectobacterium brasiliense TaxID=180957 RepID=A0A0M2EZS4_9GAMM|nr:MULTISPECIES: hypothetical protein [Pectobacterium]KGA33050.1 hypothetical protein KU74_14190 [Pectobacterium brasiliense]KMK83203.1 hypothetical protein KCO_16427 [Pectobacterium brasiliense ICMP 19477]MBA0208670.1 hypothetical protein [Pectobacterium brasiliense]MCL6328889.1 hypothetical protein [Pectobacterium carotovorum subsp. carotovorum]OYN50525.1 hypothetical protein B7L51_14950 [Pectobacterium carotovorum]